VWHPLVVAKRELLNSKRLPRYTRQPMKVPTYTSMDNDASRNILDEYRHL
jgi:hypothetical protein